MKQIMDVSGLSSIQLHLYLIDKGFCEQVAENFLENEINGAVFLEMEMEEQHLKEVAPKIRDRINLKKFQQKSSPDKVCY